MLCRPGLGLVRAFLCNSNVLLIVLCNYFILLCVFIFQQRVPKDIEALRRKRKRYKDKKKALVKFQSKIIDSTKFRLKSTTQDECCRTAYVKKDAVVNDVFEAYNKKEQRINNEAKRIRSEDLCKEKEKNSLYSEYNDPEPCFPLTDNSHTEMKFHTNLNVMDKILLNSKIVEIKSSEERAKEIARYYRDRCTSLKTKIALLNSEKSQIKLQAIHEKNQIRYFWRNKIIEGQSRSGRILRNGLNLDNNKVV